MPVRPAGQSILNDIANSAINAASPALAQQAIVALQNAPDVQRNIGLAAGQAVVQTARPYLIAITIATVVGAGALVYSATRKR